MFPAIVGCPRISYRRVITSYSDFFGERRDFGRRLSGDSGKPHSFTTRDTMMSEWSRFFLDKRPTASSRLREDIDRR